MPIPTHMPSNRLTDGTAETSEAPHSGRLLTIPAKLESAQPRRLLLVDDEKSMLSALKRLFRRDGYEIHTAESGTQALELLATTPVGVILSDQRMPGMVGTEFLRRARDLYPDTLRVTLSGFSDLQSIIDAVNEGAVYKFLMKPWDDERLRDHVAQAFAQHELAEENRRLQAAVSASHAEQAELNRRLTHQLERRSVQAKLMESVTGTLRTMMEVLPVGVLGIDPDGLLAFSNPRANAWLGALDSQPGLIVGAPLQALIDQLRACPANAEGLPIQLNGEQLLAWISPMDGCSHRGELIILMPLFEIPSFEIETQLVLP